MKKAKESCQMLPEPAHPSEKVPISKDLFSPVFPASALFPAVTASLVWGNGNGCFHDYTSPKAEAPAFPRVEQNEFSRSSKNESPRDRTGLCSPNAHNQSPSTIIHSPPRYTSLLKNETYQCRNTDAFLRLQIRQVRRLPLVTALDDQIIKFHGYCLRKTKFTG